MKRLIYLLELIDYDHFDELDNEDVEERAIIGYFSSKENLEKAVRLCKQRKEPNEIIYIAEKTLECGNNQKYVYVLCYEYSIIENDDYIDYYEYFDPQSSYSKCMAQKTELMKQDKYKNKGNRIFDDQSIEGFRVDKIKIDFIALYRPR